MKTVCIDTHAFVWYVRTPSKLGRAAIRVLRGVDEGKTRVLLPAIVVVEIRLIAEAGRKSLGTHEVEALLAAQPGFRLLAMDLDQAREFAALTSLDDPFDRLVVAAARTSGVPLVTADGPIHDSDLVEVIWD
jgi:PIN domain nuclease of toxin-antitoxin system